MEQTVTNRIGVDQIKNAQEILDKYKKGKKNLERRIIADEQWYKLHNWEQFDTESTEQIKPVGAQLFSSIIGKLADAMDNFPSANILPREQNDEKQAKILSDIIPVILDHNKFRKTYFDLQTYKFVKGTGCYSVVWDASKLNGLGDISIKKGEILNLFWESGITDIQDSANVFYTTLIDVDVLKAAYPNLEKAIKPSGDVVAEYEYDDTVDTTNKALVVDWYYKKNVNRKTVLHYVKYVGDNVLYATENDTEPREDKYGMQYTYAQRGLYDHGKYPFILDPCFTISGSPCGFGYVDVGKSPQEQIDRMNQYLLENMLVNTKPRFFVNVAGKVNEEEFADLTKDIVHYEGSIEDGVIPIRADGLSGNYLNLLQQKVDELKETTGNRDVSNGGTTGGVTSASGIAALQEASSRTSRLSNGQSYDAYSDMILMVIELIRQFYDTTRTFRITNDKGGYEFIDYNNEKIRATIDNDFGVITSSMPIFDVSVSAEKQSPYSKMAQNELALQFYGAGFFNPQMADQSLSCLSMMDFDDKDKVMQMIRQNGTMFDKLQQLEMAAAQMNAELGGQPMPMAEEEMPNSVPEFKNSGEESSITRNARERVAESTTPR